MYLFKQYSLLLLHQEKQISRIVVLPIMSNIMELLLLLILSEQFMY